MTYTAAAILGLASHCAPNVAPQTVAAIVQTESHGNPFALNVNGPRQPGNQPTAASAAVTARQYIAAGYSVDLGLGQINSRNMRKLGLTWETVFDPCTNIAALGQVLTQNYEAMAGGRNPQTALRLAISLYNTGSTSRGFRNGYVAKVVGNAGVAIGAAADYPRPALSLTNTDDVRIAAVSEIDALPTRYSDRPAPPPAWNVFERAAFERKSTTHPVSQQGTILWSN